MENGESLTLNTTFEITSDNLRDVLNFPIGNPGIKIRGVRLGDRLFAKLGEGGKGHTGIFIDVLGLQFSTEEAAPIILARVSASVITRCGEFVIESPERSSKVWESCSISSVMDYPVDAFFLTSLDGVTSSFGDSVFFVGSLKAEAHALTRFCLNNLPEEGILPELAINS